jgi:hypothetical protein
MEWFHGGFWTAWYTAFGIVYFRLLPTHDNP